MSAQKVGGLGVGQLYDFDRLESAESAPEKSSCEPWGKRSIGLAVTAGSIALRVFNLYLVTNAVASFGAGYAAVYAITCVTTPEYTIASAMSLETVARIRQVIFPIIGQTSIFAFSQAWANDQNRTDQIAFDNTIIACLGANLALAFGWLFQQGAIRSESQMAGARRGDTLYRPIVNYNVVHGLKVSAAIGLGALAYFSSDPVLRGITSFFATFFVSQVVGERLIDKIDKKIEERDIAGTGTCYRTAKTCLLTFAYIAQIVGFIPWYNPSTTQRLAQMAYVGIGLGFFDGVSDRSAMRRIERIPIEDLEELRTLAEPKKERCWSWGALKYQAYRIWKYSVPLIAMTGILGFTLWQEIAVLPGVDAKATLGAMLGGYLLGTVGSHAIDYSWDPKKRHWMKDSLMSTLWFSPRIFGIDPLFIYYAMTNAVKMDSTAIESQKSPFHLAAIILGWISYGMRMGHESFIGASDRIGSPQRKYQRMAAINGAITGELYMRGGN